jgi:uncharacterized membrane protein
MARLLNLWDTARTGFWFVPGVMTAIAVLMGFVMPIIDSHFKASEYTPWLTTTPAAAGRTLSAFGGATATARGVVFSTTIVVLSLASQQFGPRLLRTFLADRVTQITLGAFVGTSLYCLLVMRVIREVEGNPVAPDFSVALATLVSVLTLFQLIIFIHHVAVKIQAPEVLRAVANDLDDAIDRLFPERIGKGPEKHTSPQQPLSLEGDPVWAGRDGYLQAIDGDGLMSLAVQHDLVLELPYLPGEFTPRDEPFAFVRPVNKISDTLKKEIAGHFVLGSRRTPRQDVECSIWELVEVAVRALSPGINDPFTAMLSLDYLGAAIGRLAGRQMPSGLRYDDDGTLRIIAKSATIESAIDAAFNQIRQYGRTHADVTIRGLEVLQHVASRTTDDQQKAIVRRHAEMFLRAGEQLSEAHDQETVRSRFDDVTKALARETRH